MFYFKREFMTAPLENSVSKTLEAVVTKNAKVGILGLGYVGLPLIHAFTRAGFDCIGFDVDQSKVDCLNEGKSYIEHIPDEWIKAWIDEGKLLATSNKDDLKRADALLMCVPTPLNDSRDPDLRYVEVTTETIASILRPGQLVVLESTTYPGTTREVVLPILERSGLRVGEDFFLAYSPEREDPGNPDFSASSIPKVVGGYEVNSLQIAQALYGHAVVETVPVNSCEVAEACKIVENTYRCVNIAMVNELKVLFDKLNIDVWEVIDAAKTKPFGFQAFYPGPGLGGHCIPIDPFYLSWLARKNEVPTRFIELAGEVNTSMPNFVISKVIEALNSRGKAVSGSKIGVLGVAYKKDVDDDRESPSFKLMEMLLHRGAIISYSDPHVSVLPAKRDYDLPRLASEELNSDYLAGLDCVLIATDHSSFDWDIVLKHAPLIVDTRNAAKGCSEAQALKVWKA
jgi:UDP-N-acetyl-D-glucosamine dehydrogenase